MHNKNIYNENLKIPAARQQFSVRGSISVTARPRSLGGTLVCSALYRCFLQFRDFVLSLHVAQAFSE
jgi:hypothetical protein